MSSNKNKGKKKSKKAKRRGRQDADGERAGAGETEGQGRGMFQTFIYAIGLAARTLFSVFSGNDASTTVEPEQYANESEMPSKSTRSPSPLPLKQQPPLKQARLERQTGKILDEITTHPLQTQNTPKITPPKGTSPPLKTPAQKEQSKSQTQQAKKLKKPKSPPPTETPSQTPQKQRPKSPPPKPQEPQPAKKPKQTNSQTPYKQKPGSPPPNQESNAKQSLDRKPTIEEKLNSFGYKFIDGELRDIKTNGKFEFNFYPNHRDNQARYEDLGKVINQYVYYLLETETNLKRLHIPLNAKSKDARGFIFHSDDAFESDRLMLIIHGSGVVRAGQWARRLIINHSLESGTQLPYIKKAQELGYGVLVLNSNQHHDEKTGASINGISSPENHFNYVWREIVKKKCKAKHVAIVAHSYGGHIAVQGAIDNPDVLEKTFAVALTDSVHYTRSHQNVFVEWMANHVINWVSSREPLDKYVGGRDGDCMRVSAGTGVHEETSWKAFNSVWRFFDERWKERSRLSHEDEKENVVVEMYESEQQQVGSDGNHEEL